VTAEEIRALKRTSGYTYKQLSELSGVPLGTVQKILNGETKAPRRKTLEALEKVLLSEAAPHAEPAAFEEQIDTGALYESALRESTPAYQAKPTGNTFIRTASDRPWLNKKQGEYTLDDYYAIPDEYRVELIDGVIYDMSAPKSKHQLLAGLIHHQLADYVEEHDGPCVPIVSPVDVQLDCDDKTMVQPDVLIVCDRDKFQRGVIFGAPDFVVEILSKSTSRKDLGIKYHKYLDAGVNEYWVVYPDKKKVVVHDLAGIREGLSPLPEIYGEEAKVPVRIYGGACKVDFGRIYKRMAFLYEKEAQEQQEAQEQGGGED